MSKEKDVWNAVVVDQKVVDFTNNRAAGRLQPETQRDLEAALARMADPEVRTHFERLLQELGHRH